MTMAETDDVVLRADNVKKSFGGVTAVDGVSLHARKGTITGSIGSHEE